MFNLNPVFSHIGMVHKEHFAMMAENYGVVKKISQLNRNCFSHHNGDKNFRLKIPYCNFT